MSLYTKCIEKIFSEIGDEIYETERMEKIYNDNLPLFMKKYDEYKKDGWSLRGFTSYTYHFFRAYISLPDRDQVLFEIYLRQKNIPYTRFDHPHREYFNTLRARLLNDRMVDSCLELIYKANDKCYSCDKYKGRCKCSDGWSD